MTTEASLIIKVDSTQAAQANKTLADLAKQGGAAEKSTQSLTTATEKLGSTVRNVVGALGLAMSVREVVQYADAWTSAANQLRLVTDSSADLTNVQKELMQVSQGTRSEFSSTAELFSKLTRATESLGLSQNDVIGLTKTINQSFATSGATATEASNAIRQLSQGLAAGALRGDEFNSVAEQAPGIMRAIAESTGMTIGQLRDFAATGGITAEIVVTALQKASGAIEKDFSKANATLGQSITVAKNNVMEFIGTSNLLNASITEAGSVIVTASKHLDDVAAAAGIAALAMTAQLVPGMIATATQAGVAATAVGTLRASLALLTGPAGVVTLAAAGMYLFVDSAKAAAEQNEKLATSFDGVLAKLGTLTEKQLVQNIMKVQEQIDATQLLIKEKENEVKALQDGGHGYQHAARELEALNVRMTAQVSNQATLTAQLRRVQEGFVSTAAAAKNAAASTEVFTRAHVGALETVSMNTDALRELLTGLDMTAEGYASAAAATKKTGDAAKKTGDDLYDLTLRNKSYATTVADDWENAASRIARSLADLVVYGGGSLKYLGQSIASGALQGGITNLLGGGGGSSLMGSVVNGATGAMGLGNILGGAGSLGLSWSSTAGLWQAPSMLAGSGAAAGAGGLMSALGAAAPWIAGALALAAMFDKKSTPSFNAGFLTQAVPGAKADQMFSTAAFASGLNPVGFSRRSSQAEAEQTIELFRQIDKLIVDAASAGGLKVNAGALSGYSETGLGAGVFFGAAGESGRPGTALDQQLQVFATQLIGSLRGQLDDAVLEGILSAGSVDAMLAKLRDAATTTQTVADAVAEVATQEQNLADIRATAMDQFAASIQQVQDYITESMTEQRRVVESYWRDEMRQAEELHNRRAALFRNLMDATRSLQLGNLTTLSPSQQLGLAQADFRSLAAIAGNTGLSQADRIAAAEKLSGAGEAYLTAGRGMYASGGQYKQIFQEVLGALESSKFLGTNQAFSATPYENAMLSELAKLNEQVGKLPDGFASRMASMMFNLFSQGLAAGKTPEQIANIAKNLGPSAVSGLDATGLLPGGVAGTATSDATIAEQIRFVMSQGRSEEETIRMLASQAQAMNISSARLGSIVSSEFGVSGTRVDDLLAKYGIRPFATGGIVTRPTLGMVGEAGPEAVVPLGDLVGELRALKAEIVNLREWQQAADQSKVSALNKIAETNTALERRDDMRQSVKIGGAAI